uniref:Uncharacterized protein n=1 Tax=Melanopsichium pennsylvanicum 4 TaxID=1398559 RepID=A0A077R7K6_9BASI|nr:uncharacterized protein BN887_00013 [Melanopsichium pennsylvanicum 4]
MSQSLTSAPRLSYASSPGGNAHGGAFSVKFVKVANEPLRVTPNHVPPPVASLALKILYSSVLTPFEEETQDSEVELLEEEQDLEAEEKSCQQAGKVGRETNSSRFEAITKS